MKTYVLQLDYLKSLFIILMILFHLVYIGDTYPYMKQVVYTFHMPVFLILSGYLSQTEKTVKSFISSTWWLFIPYAFMEVGYVIAASFIPVREYIGELSLTNVIKRVFLDPVGPYWYLHTLLLCRIFHYTVAKVTASKFVPLSFLIVLGLCYWLFSEGLSLMRFSDAMFFLIGVGIRRCGLDILHVCQPSLWSFIPLVILCYYPNNLLRFNLAGVVITYLVISLSLWLYLRLPEKIKQVCHLIGKNTLVMLLFSPLFTMLSRIYLPVFMFDKSGVCFALFTIVLTLIGCLTIAWGMDRVHISRWMFGRERILQI